MRHVFVESNWVFAYCAPAHHRTPEAVQLAEAAAEARIAVYLPSIALREGEAAIRKKCTARLPRDLQSFRRWAVAAGVLTSEQAEAAGPLLDTFLATLQSELDALPERVSFD